LRIVAMHEIIEANNQQIIGLRKELPLKSKFEIRNVA
jgi:hypothetical protein